MEYIAHLKENGETQLLEDHLKQTAELAAAFGKDIGLEEAAYAAGMLHDDGKFQEAFQKYIRGEYRGGVDHSTAGAVLAILKNYSEAMTAMAPFCIAGHHAGLPDFGSMADPEGRGTLCARLKKGLANRRDYEACGEKAALPEKADVPMYEKIKGDKLGEMLLTRMLFSCLVDADFLDTESFMAEEPVRRGGFHTIEELHGRFFRELEEKGYFSPRNRINEKRCEILKRCVEVGSSDPGLYSLTVPTGGGKTVSSLAFAMEQAVKQHKKRIIYVIPYLSIIEQTADVFRSFLGAEDVLESHSNVNYDDEDETAEKKKLASENWDAPIVITTSEQFWESLYANRTSKCRKLHNIADSVVIFDEAQMLPREFLLPCLKALHMLVNYFGCTAVLCSATQPYLENILRDPKNVKKYQFDTPVREIMTEILALYEFFRRVRFQDDGEMTYDEAAAAIQAHEQALCIALTKSEAREIADRVTGEGAFYLSTNLCPAHRRAVIQEMKRRLKEGLPCRVVSTSVISVGVDIDFPVVYLEKTGADSLIQGAGRCNREGKWPPEESVAHLFETEKSGSTRFMKLERDLMKKTVETEGDISSPEAIRAYFRELYELEDMGERSDLDAKEIWKLAEDRKYRETGRVFHLIENRTKSVLIPYNEDACRIIDDLRCGIRTRDLMRRAAQYIVNVGYSAAYESPFSRLIANGQAEMLPNDTEIAVLTDETLYDREKFGMLASEQEGQGIEW